MLRKMMASALSALMLAGLCACGRGGTEELVSHPIEDRPTVGQTIPVVETEDEAAQPVLPAETADSADKLTALCDDELYAHCGTEDGYYYIAEPSYEKDGAMRVYQDDPHIMYVDYATKQEVYLCSDAGCQHDTEACSAVLSSDEFPLDSTRIFVWNGKLYALSREEDSEGGTSVEYVAIGEEGFAEAESRPAVLYRMNLDGSGREKVYTFENGLTLEHNVYGDGSGIYFIAKRLSTERDGNASYTSASERMILRIDPDHGTVETVCDLNWDDGITWRTVGCADRGFVFEGVAGDVDYESEDWLSQYESTRMEWVYLDLDSGDRSEIYSVDNRNLSSSLMKDGLLYVSSDSDNTIYAIDPVGGDRAAVASLPQSYLLSTLGRYLCCVTWNDPDDTLYFVDCTDGSVHSCPFTMERTGFLMELVESNSTDAIVIYDCEATSSGNGVYDVERYLLALIPIDDLVNGRATFQPIAMVGPGR